MSHPLSRSSGVALVLVSAFVFSTAGLFTKGVNTDAWGVIFWRGVAAALFTLTYMAIRGTLVAEVKAFRGPAILVTAVMALGTAAFIPAFKLTSIANVTVIYAAAPFVAAALSWVFIKEAPNRKTLIASVVSFAGVVLIVSGSLGSGTLTGDMLALWMTLMMSATMVIYRLWPNTTAALPAAMSSVVLLPVALFYGEPFAAPPSEMPILIAFGLVFAIASVTLSEGARRLPASETALLSTIETPLAPLLALLILTEYPAPLTVVGGSIIFFAVLWSQWPTRQTLHQRKRQI
ncbi:DMT family transporter [Cochlodiniinecator piscidefendens]|uniref:DMT family transporter n=1 Tax=Cochlodiniinecator piscidefendens TaxID=2715756 RepID=UPI00140CA4EF|nr:DMT family transporter [Cochlodiniinecator piscidefendens]